MALRGPQMLKDFLADDSNSCSSSGFQSFPRKPCKPTVRNLLELDLNANRKGTFIKLTRSRSKAASTTISAIHRASEIFYNAVKHFPFNSVKSPSVLPRIISRRLSRQEFWEKPRNGGDDDVREVSVTVKVKDILRWKSSRDLIEEKPPQLDFSSSPQRCTSRTTTTSTNSSSWCEGDFTAEALPFWRGSSDGYSETGVGKKCLPEEGVGGDSTVDPKGELSCEEKELHSPVSVLNSPFQEDEESFLSFHRSLPNLEGRKHMLPQNIQHFESLSKLDYDDHEYVEGGCGIEEKARQLLDHVKAGSSVEADVDRLLLDFFRHGLAASRNQSDDVDDDDDDELNCEMLRVAEGWMSGQYDEPFEWEVEGKREAYVRDIDSGARWSKFDEEQQELAMEMEIGALNYLLDELLVDLNSLFIEDSNK